MRKYFLIALMVVSGCGESNYEQVESSRFRNGGDFVKLTTCRHDGHLFVVATESGHGLALIHSPACKCKEFPE